MRRLVFSDRRIAGGSGLGDRHSDSAIADRGSRRKTERRKETKTGISNMGKEVVTAADNLFDVQLERSCKYIGR